MSKKLKEWVETRLTQKALSSLGFLVKSCQPNIDYKTKEENGSRIKAQVEDSFVYSSGDKGINNNEEVTIKVKKKVEVPVGSHIKFINPIPVLWSSNMNKYDRDGKPLPQIIDSITINCDDVQVIPTSK